MKSNTIITIFFYIFLFISCDSHGNSSKFSNNDSTEAAEILQIFKLFQDYESSSGTSSAIFCLYNDDSNITLKCKRGGCHSTFFYFDYKQTGKPCSEFHFSDSSNICYYGVSSTLPESVKSRCSQDTISLLQAEKLKITMDSTLPTITSVEPANVTTIISKFDPTTIHFSEKMNKDTLNESNIIVTLAGINQSITFIKGDNYLNIFPAPTGQTWTQGQTYTVTISSDVEDSFGNKMDSNYVYQFETN